MPRMHHEVSLLNDAKIREEASIWSAGLCGFYFCVFSSQNIAGLRLHLAICGMMNFMNFTRNSKPRSSSSISPRSPGWLKSYQRGDGEIRSFYQLNSAQQLHCHSRPGSLSSLLLAGPVWAWLGQRGEKMITILTRVRGGGGGHHQIWRKMLEMDQAEPGWTVWAGPLWSHCYNFSLSYLVSVLSQGNHQFSVPQFRSECFTSFNVPKMRWDESEIWVVFPSGRLA